MGMVMSHDRHYLMESIEYPFELWRNIDRAFGVQKEEDDSWSESNTSSCFLPSKVSASILSNEVVQDEEEVESLTQSIRIVESLLVVIPSPVAPEVYEIYDISCSHTVDPKEDIRTSIVE